MSDTLSADEERDLIAHAHDPAAFRRLYRHYVQRVFAYVVYRVGTKQDAEDIVSDIFVKVLESISSFEYRGAGSFAAWLFRRCALIPSRLYPTVTRWQTAPDCRQIM